ncbi:hypothetical protein BV20DRAFT_379632 [Pilatotrama ljubarskyi]|nr:hypothetical protein BV20DRAFT_379632 [Pilatotrama ljubarskyi]
MASPLSDSQAHTLLGGMDALHLEERPDRHPSHDTENVWYPLGLEGQAVHEYVADEHGYPAHSSSNLELVFLERCIPTARHRAALEQWQKACWERFHPMTTLPAELDFGNVGEANATYRLHYGFIVANEAISAYVRRLGKNDSYPPESLSHLLRAALRHDLPEVPERYAYTTRFQRVVGEKGVRWLVSLYTNRQHACFRASSTAERIIVDWLEQTFNVKAGGPLMWYYDFKHLPEKGVFPKHEHEGMSESTTLRSEGTRRNIGRV